MLIKKITASLLPLLLLLTSCSRTAYPDNTENAAEAISATEISTEASADTDHTTAAETQPEDTENEAAADKGIYTTVTDADGNSKVLYYIPDSDKGTAFIYMSSRTEDPEDMMGYVSVLSENTASERKELVFGEDTRNIFSYSSAPSAYIYYMHHDKTGDRCSSESIGELADLILNTVPQFTEADEENVSYEYTPRYPVMYAELSDGSDSMSTSLLLSFAVIGDRLAAKCRIYDYSALDRLAAENTATESQLSSAYSMTTEWESDWFYADSLDEEDGIYDRILRMVIMSENNGFDRTRQCRTESRSGTDGYTGEIAEYLSDGAESTDSYKAVYYRNDISLMLPDGTEPTYVNNILVWKQDGITVKISENSTGPLAGLLECEEAKIYRGEFYGNSALCVCGYRDKDGKARDLLSICGRDGECYVTITSDGTENREEYEALCRSIFGSFALCPEKAPESAESIYGKAAAITLSDTPSVYGSEGYAIAEGTEDTGYDLAVPVFQAYVPRVLVGDMYALDFRNEYETVFGCIIEKLCEDGNWYRVLPVAETYEANGNKWHEFYNVLDTGRKPFMVDMSVYPPLPEGRYRLVRPVRKKDEPLKEYGAFVEFDMVNTGEVMNISACCKQSTYDNIPESITAVISSDIIYMQSEHYDIEYYEENGWHSVRTAPIRINSIGGSFSLDLAGLAENGQNKKVFSTEGFDLSAKGRYRLRFSVCDFSDGLSDEYAVLYAEFEIT